MNFSRIAKQLKEDNPSLAVSADSSEKAKVGGEKQKSNTNSAKEKQKAQMAKQSSVPMKSDVSYTSEEARRQREYEKMLHNQSSDWRTELIEAAGVDAEGNHPYVDVMPFVNQKAMEAKRQLKAGAKMKMGEGLDMEKEFKVKDNLLKKEYKMKKKALKKQEKSFDPIEEAKELSIEDQMRISREAAKNRKPYDPQARFKQRTAQLKQMAKNDTRTQREKETQGRYLGGGRYAGD